MVYFATVSRSGSRNSVDGDGEHRKSQITTGFRLRMWWLRMFRGYHLDSTRRMPKQNIFGEIYYNIHWVLSRRDKE